MATIFSRKNVDAVCRACAQQYNALHEATISTSTDGYHRDISGVVDTGDSFSNPISKSLQVTAASATTLPTVLLSALNIQAVLHMHFADAEAHLKADSVNVGLDGYAIDNTSATTQQSSANLMLNAAKVVLNAHLTQSGVHRKSDTANSVATTDASNLATSETLANALKSAINAHIVSGPTVGRVHLLDG